MTTTNEKLSIIGRERALIDALAKALHATIGGPPPSKKTLEQVRRHQQGSRPWETWRGSAFEVRLVGPDGDVTGHIVRVTIEADRFEAPER